MGGRLGVPAAVVSSSIEVETTAKNTQRHYQLCDCMLSMFAEEHG